MVGKTGDFAQRIVSAAMGVAGEGIQRFELAEDGDVDGSAEGLLHFVEGGDLVAAQKRAQFIGAVGEGSHNKSRRDWLSLTEEHQMAVLQAQIALHTLRGELG